MWTATFRANYIITNVSVSKEYEVENFMQYGQIRKYDNALEIFCPATILNMKFDTETFKETLY
jgi:hypothetical protein